MKAPTFVCVFFIITISFKSRAQILTTPDDHKVHVTFAAGYVQGEIKGSYVVYHLNHYLGSRKPELYGSTGIEAEVLLNFKIYKFLYGKSGIGYNEQGGRIQSYHLVYPVDVTLRYIHIPASVGAHLVTAKKFTLMAETGIQLNQEISSEQDFKKGTINKNWSKTFIPAFTYRVLVQYRISNKLSIQGSFKSVDALQPFYQEEYFTSRNEMSTEAKSYAVGLVFSMK